MPKFNLLSCPKLNEYGSNFGSTTLHFPTVELSEEELTSYNRGNFLHNLSYCANPDPEDYTSHDDVWSQHDFLQVRSFKEALDIQHLERTYLGVCDKLGISEDDILESIDDFGYTDEQIRTDINIFYYAVIDQIFQTYLLKVSDYFEENYPAAFETINKMLEDERDNFSPFINCLDSWFNNVLDEIEIEDNPESFKEYVKMLSKSKK